MKPRSRNLSDYITPNESEIKELALFLRRYFPHDYDFVMASINITRQLVYENDSTPFNFKYPLETLVEGSGDCEDLATFLVSLLRAGGIDSVLIIFENHVGVGINIEGINGYYFKYNKRKYYYIEITNKNYNLGELPINLYNKKYKIIH